MSKKTIVVALAALTLMFITVGKSPVHASTIIIAASNSDSTWKSEATAVCSGTNDQNTINSHLTSNATVELAPGTFNINGPIYLASGDTLYGQGNTTILDMQNNNGSIYAAGVSDVTVYSLEVSGNELAHAGVFVCGGNNYSIHDIKNVALGGIDFEVYSNAGTTSNISFVRCDANNPDSFGFFVGGESTPCNVTNLVFFDCSVENAGVASTRANMWATGFDFAEYAGETISNLTAMKCSVNGAWESDFHTEESPLKVNFVILDCAATGAGQKPGATYGAGYLISDYNSGDGFIVNGNTGGSNALGDLRIFNKSTGIFDVHTPPINYTIPAQTVNRVSVGNCAGIAVTDGSAYDLYLYSTDGQPVNQVVTLPNGNTQQVTFTDYHIAKVVTPSITTSSLPNGTVGTAYSQALAASGGTAPYTWSITSGTLPAGLSLSSVGVISGTPTTVGGPTSITFQVTDNTGATATKALTVTINSAALSIMTGSLPNGTVGTAYSQALAASGGTSPYSWTIVSGTLPAGLTLRPGGVISGTPTAAGGPTSVTFQVTDTVSATATKSLSITINSAPTNRHRSRSG